MNKDAGKAPSCPIYSILSQVSSNYSSGHLCSDPNLSVCNACQGKAQHKSIRLAVLPFRSPIICPSRHGDEKIFITGCRGGLHCFGSTCRKVNHFS